MARLLLSLPDVLFLSPGGHEELPAMKYVVKKGSLIL
jgi:hypothetical protein